jgi:hypothetical protein
VRHVDYVISTTLLLLEPTVLVAGRSCAETHGRSATRAAPTLRIQVMFGTPTEETSVVVPANRLDPFSWQSQFMALLPAIERHAQRAFRNDPVAEREEGVQSTIVSAMVAYARLVERGRAHLAFPTPLANYGVRHHRSGRRVGGRQNCRDLMSPVHPRDGGDILNLKPSGEWKEAVLEDRRITPAELAAIRIDFEAWLATLSHRDRCLANFLASGEDTSAAAQRFRLTPGRISQLRRKLRRAWEKFTGEEERPERGIGIKGRVITSSAH